MVGLRERPRELLQKLERELGGRRLGLARAPHGALLAAAEEQLARGVDQTLRVRPADITRLHPVDKREKLADLHRDPLTLGVLREHAIGVRVERSRVLSALGLQARDELTQMFTREHAHPLLRVTHPSAHAFDALAPRLRRS